MNAILPAILVLIAVIMLAIIVVFISILRVWVRALTSGVPVHVLSIVGMRLRGNPAQLLIDAYVILSKEGLETSLDETEYVFMQNRSRVRFAEELVRLVKERKQKK